jgi:hypothetical protein
MRRIGGGGSMADELSGQERQRLAAHAAARRQRDDAFSRLLGDEWVEVEPGIYRQQTRPAPSAGSLTEPGRASFDQGLLDALSLLDAPADDEESSQPIEPAPQSTV